jgi:hypothetical protein
VKNPGHALKACPNGCKVGKCATGRVRRPQRDGVRHLGAR